LISCEIIFDSELNSKNVFQDVQPIGGVGWSPSGNPGYIICIDGVGWRLSGTLKP